MRAIIEQIEAGIGGFLKSQGLKAVYEATEDMDVEDDVVAFVADDGRHSVVYLQVSSFAPSLDNAFIHAFDFKTVDLPIDGWKFAACEGITEFQHPKGKEGLLAKLKEVLEDNAGSFDLTDGRQENTMTNPHSDEAIRTILEYASASGIEFGVSAYAKGDDEGFILAAEDGRTARIEVLPTGYQVTVAGERSNVPFRFANRAEMLKDVLENGFEAPSMRP